MKKTFVHIFLVILIGVIVYSNTLDVPFHFDDDMYVYQNPLIKDSRFIFDREMSDTLNLTRDVRSTRSTRFIGYLTFFLNYRLGKLSVEGYHMFNIAIHIVNALLIYLLARLMFRVALLSDSVLTKHSKSIALLSALLFISHPVQTQAVTYISQRFTSLTATFYFISLASYIISRHSDRNPCRVTFYVLALASTVVAMMTKEIAFMLPVSIALSEFIFFRAPIKRRIAMLVPFFLAMSIIPLSLADFSKPIGEALLGATVTQADFSRFAYFVTQFRVLVTYFRLLALPVGQNLDYDYPVYDSFLLPGVLLSFLFLSAMITTGIIMLRRSRLGLPWGRIIAFGLFWFFVTISVESSVILLADVIFEHRLYIPSFGIFLAFSTGMFALLTKVENKKMKRATVIIIVTLPLIFSAAAYARNDVWKSEISLWSDVIKKSPNKARAYNNLGIAHRNRGEQDRALEMYKTALTLKPNYALAHNNIGILYGEMKFHDEAIKHYKAAIRYEPDNAEAHFNLGVKYVEKGRMEEARREFETAVRIMPYNVQARKFLTYVTDLQEKKSP